MRRRRKQSLQQGATLVFALCMLVVMLLLGVSAAQLALQGERSARAERDRQLAFQAAEEALMDAQIDIEGRPGAAGRSTAFDSVASFADCAANAAGSSGSSSSSGSTDSNGSTDGAQAGLCLPAASGAAPLWRQLALDAQDAGAMVDYGRFTGAAMASGAGMLPTRRPRYLVELLPAHLPGEEVAAAAGEAVGAGHLYRITAIGFGAQADTQVVLQTYYRKRASSTVAQGAAP